jgi:hypothetical protein
MLMLMLMILLVLMIASQVRREASSFLYRR